MWLERRVAHLSLDETKIAAGLAAGCLCASVR